MMAKGNGWKGRILVREENREDKEWCEKGLGREGRLGLVSQTRYSVG